MKHYAKNVLGSLVQVCMWHPKDNPSQVVKSITDKRRPLENFTHKWYTDRGYKVIGIFNLGYFQLDDPNSLHNGLLARDSGLVEGVPHNGHEMWLNKDGKLNIEQLNLQGVKGIGSNWIWGTSLSYQLVKDGKKVITGTKGFSTSVNNWIAYGQDAEGNMIVACASNVDADKMADIMVALGCIKAIMGDGGGSVEMIVNGEQTFASGRNKGTAMMVFGKEDATFISDIEGIDITKPNITWRNGKEYQKTPLKLSSVDGIAIHHMAHPSWNFYDVHNFHRDSREWFGVGYNYWIGFDGKIYEGRGLSQGAGVKSHNDHLINIGFQGNYQLGSVNYQTEMPDSQFNAGVDLINWLQAKIPTIRTIHGHKYWQSTACPGNYFPLVEMISNNKRGQPEPTKPKTLYRVQVGAFGVKSNAENLAKELRLKGYQTIIKEEKQ
jgi:N-acetylmuramoyl-L-alanine amidase